MKEGTESVPAITPFFQQKFTGLIWKMSIDAGGPALVIESRNPDVHTSSISAFNYMTGECYFLEKAVTNSWQYSLNTIWNGQIFLDFFAGEHSPVRKGFTSLDLTGNISWEAYDLALEAVAIEGLLVYDPRLSPRRLKLIPSDQKTPVPFIGLKYTLPDPGIIYPHETADVMLLKPFFSGRLTGPVWRAIHGDKTCYCFHSITGSGFSQQLLIIAKNEVIAEEFLTTDIQKLNPEAFFIVHDRLFCIRNKNEIVSYSL